MDCRVKPGNDEVSGNDEMRVSFDSLTPVYSEAPSTTLRVVPLPRCAGADRGPRAAQALLNLNVSDLRLIFARRRSR
jgi:hypothetical protein